MGRRAVLLGITALTGATEAALAAPRQPGLDTLEIVTAKGRVRFDVEVADNDVSREKGLMFRKTLAPDRGMLFNFKAVQPVAFWMRNTLIPLDMLFIDASGTIISIARNAQPHDETPIGSGGPVLAVLEIPGGRAAQIGVLPGDRIVHRIFSHGR